jgi:hypothetical protein
MGRECSMNEKRNAYRLLVGKPEGRKPLKRPTRRWVDNIKIYLGKIGLGGAFNRIRQNRNTQNQANC